MNWNPSTVSNTSWRNSPPVYQTKMVLQKYQEPNFNYTKCHTLISELQKLMTSVPMEFRDNITVNVEAYDDYGSATTQVEIYYTRPANQEEIKKKKLEDEAQDARRKLFDIQQLQALKEMYPDA